MKNFLITLGCALIVMGCSETSTENTSATHQMIKTLGIIFLATALLACQTTVINNEVVDSGKTKDGPIMEGSKEDIAAVFQVFADWGAARDAGNVDGVVAVHDPDMLIMTRDQEILRGHDGVRDFYAQNYYDGSTREMFNQVIEVRVLGEVAIVIGRFLVIDIPKEIEDPGYYLSLIHI